MVKSTRVVSRAPHQSHTKEFLKLIASVAASEGWRTEEVLSHWLSASCYALLGAAHSARFYVKASAYAEQRYMEVVGRARSPQQTMERFGEALAIIVEALEVDMSDVLSPIFSEIAAASSLGQFFTPYSLSLVCAENALQDAPAMLAAARKEGRNFLLMCEPACGVGGMILAANSVLRDMGIDPATDVHWEATDLDWRAVCGAYIQCTFTGASASIRHGNSLTNEIHEELPTIVSVLHPKRIRSSRSMPAPVETPGVMQSVTTGSLRSEQIHLGL